MAKPSYQDLVEKTKTQQQQIDSMEQTIKALESSLEGTDNAVAAEQIAVMRQQLEAAQLQLDQTNEQMQEQADENKALKNSIEHLRSVDAKNNPASIRKTAEIDPNRSIGAATFADDSNLIEIPVTNNPDSREFKDKQALEAFMAEKVDIHIATTSERNAQKVFQVGVNGDKRLLVRGQTYRVPRYIIASLVDSRPVDYVNHEYQEEGIHKVAYDASEGLRVPLTIVRDSQRGMDWFSRQSRCNVSRVHV